MASEKVVAVTKNNFDSEVIGSSIPALVDFWAPWCGPCRAVAPIMDELAEGYQGKVKICKINVDEEGELAARFRVMSIPTIILFKAGQVVEKAIGARSKEEFRKMLDNNI
ncbi:MAG: thioredoxin [Clostridia bacterium]|nr:thioredoxin [Clostridia bacterium]